MISTYTEDPFAPDSCDLQNLGDVENDGDIDMSDIIKWINWMFKEDSPPPVRANADVNADCCIDIEDIIYLIDSQFHGGPPPPDCTCENPPICVSSPLEPFNGQIMHHPGNYLPINGDPTTTQWRELWPKTNHFWDVAYWDDRDSDTRLSVGDSLYWIHTIAAGLIAEAVQLVTPTIAIIRPGYPNDTIFMEMLEPPVPFSGTISRPVGTIWQEAYPNAMVQNQIVHQSTYNNNLSVGDEIWWQILTGPESLQVRWGNIVEIKTDIIIKPLIVPGDEYDYSSFLPIQGNPIGSNWYEFRPEWLLNWDLEEWFDNGDGYLSLGDTVKAVESGNPDNEIWKLIDFTNPVIELQSAVQGGSYLGLNGTNPMIDPINNIVGTYWTYLESGNTVRMICNDWADNGNGYLDSCDYIYMMFIDQPDSGFTISLHVETSLQTEITSQIIEAPACDCIPGDADGNEIINLLDVTYIIKYLYKGGPPPTPYPVCSGDPNCDCIVNLLDVTYLISYLYKGGPPPCDCILWNSLCAK
jgi:hypothetical protein